MNHQLESMDDPAISADVLRAMRRLEEEVTHPPVRRIDPMRQFLIDLLAGQELTALQRVRARVLLEQLA